MTAPSTGRDDATIRGAVVLVVAIVIGLALLARSGSDGSDDSAATTEVATSSTEFDGSTTSASVPGPINSTSTTTSAPAPVETRPPDAVTVIVLNGTTANVDGIAGDNDAKVAAAGYQTLDATGADIDVTTTTIYADAEFQADAEAVKAVLGIPDAVVEEKPAEPPGPNSEMANVIVVIGDDAAG